MVGCVSGPPPRPETYVVRAEDTLYSIAWRFDLNFRDLASWNDLGVATQLTVGQILMLRPMPGASPAPANAAAAAATRAAVVARKPMPRTEVPRVEPPRPLPDLRVRPGAGAVAAASVAAPPQPPAPAAVAVSRDQLPVTPGNSALPLTWDWPTRALRRPAAVPGGGVLMFGALGQDVLAAAAGRVVYVGAGIRGYGNLVIIKHSDSLLSAYAHNREVTVRESQQVRLGERLGAMGLGPRQVPALYFEIRVNGKPEDVFAYLKKK